MRGASRGSALPLLLGLLLIMGTLLGAIVAAFQNSARRVGETHRVREMLTESDARLERARARLMLDPWAAFGADEADLTWDEDEPCLLGVRAFADGAGVSETWVVTAVNRFAVFADSRADLQGGASVSGSIFAGSERAFGETGGLDPALYAGKAESTIETDSFAYQIVQSVVLVKPTSGEPVKIHDVMIQGGVLIVEGDAVLSGEFSGTPKENWPLLVVTGNLTSEEHEDAWSWSGVVAASGDVALRGPGSYQGVVMGANVALDDGLTGQAKESPAVFGLEPKIRRRARDEVWRASTP